MEFLENEIKILKKKFEFQEGYMWDIGWKIELGPLRPSFKHLWWHETQNQIISVEQ